MCLTTCGSKFLGSKESALTFISTRPKSHAHTVMHQVLIKPFICKGVNQQVAV